MLIHGYFWTAIANKLLAAKIFILYRYWIVVLAIHCAFWGRTTHLVRSFAGHRKKKLCILSSEVCGFSHIRVKVWLQTSQLLFNMECVTPICMANMKQCGNLLYAGNIHCCYISANLLAAYSRSGPEWPNAFQKKSTAFTVCVRAHWHSTIARLLLKSALAKSGPWHKCVHLAHPKRLYIVAALSSSELDLELYKCNKLQWTATAHQQQQKNAQRTGLKFVSYKSLSYS